MTLPITSRGSPSRVNRAKRAYRPYAAVYLRVGGYPPGLCTLGTQTLRSDEPAHCADRESAMSSSTKTITLR